MKKLLFFEEFHQIDPAVVPRVTKVDLRPYQIDVYVSNLLDRGMRNSLTKNFFNVPKVLISHDEESRCLKLSLPRIKVPVKPYDLKTITALFGKEENKWVLGINDFGPVEFDITKLTHALVVGSSGYGKSAFFKFLLAQTLRYQPEVMNFVIDPKKIDYSLYSGHPNLHLVADEKEKWINLLYLILTEIEVRKEYYVSAFKRAPNNLEEYNSFRTSSGRKDLPKFKRFLVWIDEYHLLHRSDMSTEVEREALAHIARMGRAFGIHLICSSQAYNDFSGDIKQQASTIFNFFTSSSFLNDVSQHQPIAIPGRMNFAFGKEFTENVQTPFVTTEESLRFAYKGAIPQESEKVSPFQRLQFSEMSDLGWEYVMGLMLGQGLYKKNPRKPMGPARVSDALFRKYHDIGVKQRPGVMPSATNEVEELKNYFAKSKAEQAPSPSMTDEQAVKKLEIPQTDNGFNLRLLQEPAEEEVPFDLDWCRIDSEKSFGLQLCYENMLGSEDEKEVRTLDVEELALSYQNRQTLLKYLIDLEESIARGSGSPLLILKGREGMGKRTLMRAVAKRVHLPYRTVDSRDFLLRSAQMKESKREILIFESLDAIKDHCHSTSSPVHAVLLLDSGPKSNLFGSVDFSFDELKFLGTHFQLIDLDHGNYDEVETGNTLLRGILKQYHYDFESGFLGIEFLSQRGVPVHPEKIDRIVSRASNRCSIENRSFSLEFLRSEVENFASFRDHSHSAVEVIKPSREMDDIVLNPELQEQLEAIVQFSRSLGETQYQFQKRLRKSPRLIALFHGPSGTGKSLGAEVIAKALNKDLWVVNFADLQSKYVGETEKILSDLFQRAALARQVLLIDECEVFLGNRDVKQSEYMSRIINHILNLFESYKGILILTSNYADSIDRAFARRIDVKAEFKLPGPKEMGSILKNLLLPDAPLAEELDTDFIFSGLSLSGGVIRNAVERLVQKNAGRKDWAICNDDLRDIMLQLHKENQAFTRNGGINTLKIGLKASNE